MLILILLFAILAFAVLSVREKDLLYASVYLGAVSVSMSVLFIMLSAPDIALTEAAIGAGISTFIFVAVVKKTERREE